MSLLRWVKTDKQADVAAKRSTRLERRLARIEQRAKAKIEKLQDQIAAVKTQEEKDKEKAVASLKTFRGWLLDFANLHRGRRRTYILPSGTTLEVNTVQRVVSQDGDDQAAIAELEALGLEEFVRIGQKEIDRASLRQKKNRHVFSRLTRLSLQPVQTLKIKPPK